MEKNFLEHLEDLRRVVIRALLSVAVIFPAAVCYAPEILDFIVKFSCPLDTKFNYFSPMEPLMVQLKLGLTVAVFAAFPYIIYELWHFIAPGLYRHEKRFALLLVTTSWILFIAGVAVSLFLIMPMVMRFSLSMGTPWLQPVLGLQNFISLATFMLLGFGLIFQFPIAIFLLVKTGLVELALLKRQRAIVFVVILVLSAILTPTPDIMTMLIMALPTYCLFEISLLVAGFTQPATKMTDADANTAPPATPQKLPAVKRKPRKIHFMRRN
jgi:sec-independent protein translocase protein TatC